MTSTNNFVIRFANVNGTGSASANGMVTKTLFRMGLDVGPKNMFPSNIQGFPTWYEIRISDRGYTARRGGVDLMVAMNPETYQKDLDSLSPGGYYLYDEARYEPRIKRREDVHYLPIPLTDLVQDFPSGKSRPMLKNVIYVGAIAALIELDLSLLRNLITDLFGKNQKLIDANFKALELGFDHARSHFACPLPIHVRPNVNARDRILVDGNQALALGSVFAGATVCSWYPITPSTSVIDHFEKFCKKFRKTPSEQNQYAIIQAEDELAAAGMVIGASWNGARAFTATSGPGISLMAEFLGFAYYAEIPAVIFDIQRVGPSTGMPTRTQQADLLSTAYLSHGDTRHVLLFPANPRECFEFALKSFDLAELLQTPVILMSDIELGMNEYVSDPLIWDESYRHNRGKVLDGKSLEELGRTWYRYEDVDGDGICYRTLPGAHPKLGATLTRGSGHDKFGRYTEDDRLYQDNMDRLGRKWHTAKHHLPEPAEHKRTRGNDLGMIYLGVLEESVREALDLLAAKGYSINALRIRAFPFGERVRSFVDHHKKVFVLDQNRDGQLRSLLLIEENFDPAKLISVTSYDGLPLTADALRGMLETKLQQTMATPDRDQRRERV